MAMTDVGEHGSGILERDDDLDHIVAMARAGLRGEGGVVVVEGPAGIGKSALLEAVAEPLSCACVLSARGFDLESGYAFGVVRQLFSAHLTELSQPERHAVQTGPAAITRRLFDGTTAVGNSMDPEPVRGFEDFSLFNGLYWLTANLAERTPLVLVVDDLHWCDTPSLRFLAFLAGRVTGTPITLIGATRPPDGGPDDRLIATLRDRTGAVVVRPRALSRLAVRELISVRFGDEPDIAVVDACSRVTGGNPFLVHELLQDLTNSEVTPTDDLVARISASGPEQISASAWERLQSAGEDVGRLVRAAAILDGYNDLTIAARIADLDWSVAAEAARVAWDAGILSRPLRPERVAEAKVEFTHPVVRRAIATHLSPSERSGAHRRAADELRRVGADVEAVAGHLLYVPPSADFEVVGDLAAAAETAISRGAPDAAIRYLQRARIEPPPPDAEATVVGELGRALVVVGHAEEAVETLRSAQRRTDDPVEAASLARQIAAVLVHDPKRGAEAIAVLEEGIDGLPDGAAIGPFLEADIGTADFVSLSARRIARHRVRRFDDPTCPQLKAVDAMATVLYSGPAAHANALANRALAGGRLLEAETATSATFWLAALTLIYGHELVGAKAVTNQAMAAAVGQGSKWGVALASCFRSRINFLCGNLLDAELDARRFLDLAPDSLAVGPAFLVDSLVEQGRYDEAGTAIATRAPGSLNAAMYHFLVCSESVLRLRQGDHRAALDRIFDLAEGYREWGTSTPGPIQWRTHAAEAYLALGERDRAQKMIDDELEACHAFGAPSCLGAAVRVAGLVAGGERGAELLAQSVELLRPTPCRLDHARALIDYGMQLRHLRRRREARVHLTSGMDLASDCGATALATRGYDELRATGARPRRRAGDVRMVLTPSERRVARLAAAGRSNRQIAQELFVTVRTVETHLSNTYRKLDIHNRSDLRGVLEGLESAKST